MKIASIAGGKHPIYKKGDPVPLEPEKKVLAQAKFELSNNSDKGFIFLTTKASLEGPIHLIKGRETKEPEPNQYIGTVKITYRPLRTSDDRLFREKTTVVKIHCQDSKDELGLPDVETVTFEILK